MSRDSAQAWLDYAETVIADLRQIGADRAPPEVLDTFAELVATWRSELDGEPAGGPTDGRSDGLSTGRSERPFHWVSDRSDDEVGYLINALYETGLAVERAHETGSIELRPPGADEFHYAVVNQVLAALEAEGGPQSHLVEILREHWGVAGD